MNYAASQYQAQSGTYLSHREIEAMAFRHINAMLTHAKNHDDRQAALHTNQRLWGIFLQSLQRVDCPLSPILRQDLMTLSTWSLRHSNTALMQPTSLQPLIDVNNDMIAGLTSQTAVSNPSSPAAHFALTG